MPPDLPKLQAGLALQAPRAPLAALVTLAPPAPRARLVRPHFSLGGMHGLLAHELHGWPGLHVLHACAVACRVKGHDEGRCLSNLRPAH